jgi:AcrR family transcriptional regulator
VATREQGRPQQRLRTRKDLLQAAARLMQQGRKPSLDEVAAEAMVSRATAYRYFPDAAALLAEASLDLGVPTPEELFADAPPLDPVARLQKLDDLLNESITSRESQMRIMLAHSVMRAVDPKAGEAIPARQNRRVPLITAALAPARSQFTPAALRNLEQALALVIGTESVIVTRDVLRIDDAQARRIKHWAIRALVEAARKPGRKD